MKTKLLLMAVLFLIVALLITANCFAAIYKYLDKDGAVCFADDLQAVPEQYRQTVMIVSGEAKEIEKKVLSNKNISPVQREARQGEAAPAVTRAPSVAVGTFFSKRALISALIVLCAIVAFVVLKIIDRDHKKTMAIARMMILWGVSAYVIYAHAGDVLRVFTSIGEHIENAKQRSEEKGEKAAKAVKDLNSFLEQQNHGVSTVNPAGGDGEKKE
jgi:hypothetical protein